MLRKSVAFALIVLCVGVASAAYTFALNISYITNDQNARTSSPGWGDGGDTIDFITSLNTADSTFNGFQYKVWAIKCNNDDEGATRPAIDAFSDTVYTATFEHSTGEYVVSNAFDIMQSFNLPLSNIDLPDGRAFNIDRFDTVFIMITDKYGRFSATDDTGCTETGFPVPQRALIKVVFNDPSFESYTGTLELVNANDRHDPFGAGVIGAFYLRCGGTSYTIVNLADAVDEKTQTAPQTIALLCNPNPFNATVEINFALASPNNVRLEIVDMLGKHVRTLSDAALSIGAHTFTWDGADDSARICSSGTYFCKLFVGNKFATAQKLIFAK